MNLPKLGPRRPDVVEGFVVPTNWGIADRARFYALMNEAIKLLSPAVHFGDNLLTWARSNSPLEDPAFRSSWEGNIKNESDRVILWRRYVLACAAYHCVNLPGDFVECGVFQGSGMGTVLDYLGGRNFPKTFWGFDTFDYHPVESHQTLVQRAGFYEQVKGRFEGYPQVKLVKGLIPASFDKACPERVCYLHIDMNNAEAEIAALERLFDRVVSGGIIIFDDYEWSAYRKQKIAEDAWLDARSYRVFPLPTGQGLVIKR